MTADRWGSTRKALWHLRTGGPRQLRAHLTRRTVVRRQPAGAIARTADGLLQVEAWPVPDRQPNRPNLRVAVIADDFTRLALAYEWTQVEITPATWREVLERDPVHLLFVESAWRGNGGAWQYHLTGPTAPRPALTELVQWCRVSGIVTVFWNKEDPAHYADFLDTARLFDHVWTTDVERVPDYVRDLGHERVGVMPFAAAPAIHNPVRPAHTHATRDVAFAGMYFREKYPERRAQMDLLLGAALAVSPRMDTGLEIFSRFLGGEERFQFPERFAERIVGSLSYEQMLTAYRAYKVFLNVNSVVGSPSMCARRIFEITACGTPVVSTPSPAIEAFFPSDEVPQVHSQQEAEWTLRALVNSPELRDRMVHLGQRRIWREHTYGARIDAVLDAAHLPQFVRRRPSVSALVVTNRPHQLDHVLATVGAQIEVEVELVLVCHGWEPPADLDDRAGRAGVERIVVQLAGPETTLGSCLNLGAAAASGEVIAKLDDDDLYGPHYLFDSLAALEYSGADVVGKQAHHMYLGELDLTVLRFPDREHRFTDLVMGPTIVVRRDVARANPFPDVALGEDTAFVRGLASAGAAVYSCDRFGFVQVRSVTAEHTWRAGSAELLAGGRVVATGPIPQHVLI